MEDLESEILSLEKDFKQHKDKNIYSLLSIKN